MNSLHCACQRQWMVLWVASRLFVPFFVLLQGIDFPLCSSVKTCCRVKPFIQVVMQVFRHAMPQRCLSHSNKLGSKVAAGLKGSFYLFKHSAIPVCHLTNCAWVHVWFGFMVVLVTMHPACRQLSNCCWPGNDVHFGVQVAGWACQVCLQFLSWNDTSGFVPV